MTIHTDNSGVACCGNCGSHVVVACSGGCAEPDVMFRKDYIASLPKPKGPEPGKARVPKGPKVAKYPPPTHCFCGEPVAKRRVKGRGRPPTKCETHVVRKKAAP